MVKDHVSNRVLTISTLLSLGKTVRINSLSSPDVESCHMTFNSRRSSSGTDVAEDTPLSPPHAHRGAEGEDESILLG